MIHDKVTEAYKTMIKEDVDDKNSDIIEALGVIIPNLLDNSTLAGFWEKNHADWSSNLKVEIKDNTLFLTNTVTNEGIELDLVAKPIESKSSPAEEDEEDIHPQADQISAEFSRKFNK